MRVEVAPRIRATIAAIAVVAVWWATLVVLLPYSHLLDAATLALLPTATVLFWIAAWGTAVLFHQVRVAHAVAVLSVSAWFVRTDEQIAAMAAVWMSVSIAVLSCVPEQEPSRSMRCLAAMAPLVCGGALVGAWYAEPEALFAIITVELAGVPLSMWLMGLACTMLAFDVWRTDAVSSRGLAATLVTMTGAPMFANGEVAWFVAAAVALLTSLEGAWRLAFLDSLTGLPGRHALNDRLGRLGRTYAIAIVDVDHFKRFNDRYGHDSGDEVLRRVARILARVRGGHAYRMGGEEFALVFPRRSSTQVEGEVNRLRKQVGALSLHPVGKSGIKRKRTVRITFSAGLSESEDRISPSGVLKSADNALYRAKNRGRNRVVVGR